MKYLLLVFILIFSACSNKSYDKTKTKIIFIKSPKIKFADLGYIRNSDEEIELELFIAGKTVEKISINKLICVSNGCMSKSGFNKDYLNSAYPEDTLQNILLSRPIYEGKHKKQASFGFIQYIKDEYVDIAYVVTQHMAYFKDKKNRIIFKIKDTESKDEINVK